MRFTLKQLEVFLAVAREENVSAAADRLSMSQSAVSEALKNLESQFDIVLFDRLGRSLKLNALGRAMQQETSNLIERAQVLERSFSQHTADVGLNLGATLSIGNYLAVRMISQFKSSHLDAKVNLKVANTTEIAERVLSFELDIGLIEGEINHSELVVEQWLPDELVVFCSPSHPYASLKTVSDKKLKEAHWVLRESGSGTRQAFDHAMHGLLSDLHIELELEHTEAIKRAVEYNVGIGCLSRITLNDAFSRGALIPLSTPHRNFKRSLYLIHHRDKFINNTMSDWLSLCRSSMNE
ncbi:LysR family transcriptional regulator [Oleiphilus sp. HI0071]|uniref:LysR substrate-binding domain-containing protein n=2 Tax=Oleiphilus TaxID=141450 RepID=UPI0007C2CB9E|nr:MULTISPECIES: LysR substrate-binding domain-containing protein [unclassified Oleiphilus]KZY59199.1 LysR family transcriptional regulator [Oleiphilus sp. HI0065]KZY80068.1 LysR family transcriptional regulator [Oleiphilus sp. HI0071]KZY96668.1 LysR family transcriptional regulator [Oleiphilus sp. HI0073]KZZ50822.1 LysR family transcriptional regulator [Oleiphilus sp. HI0122]KZZ65796.1 LysR family transcriptional regulator [Oleiphilus sp. HI0130]KZZ74192.1 LysR family transcriptional regulat